MIGDLWFGCGTGDDEHPLWRAMLTGRRARIVYWPFALPRPILRTAEGWLRGNLDQLGVEYELDTWTSLADHDPTELTTTVADVLFVGGGNTFRLLDHVRRAGFIDAAREFHRAGGDYYGGSAGAVLACESIAIADGHNSNDGGLTDLTALGLIQDLTILPHFTTDQLEATLRWARQYDTTVLGLPETIGLHCIDSTATVIGSGTLTVITPSTVEYRTPGAEVDLGTRWLD